MNLLELRNFETYNEQWIFLHKIILREYFHAGGIFCKKVNRAWSGGCRCEVKGDDDAHIDSPSLNKCLLRQGENYFDGKFLYHFAKRVCEICTHIHCSTKKHYLVLYLMCLQKGSIRIKGEDSPSMAANQDDESAGRKIVWMEGRFSSLKNFSQLFVKAIGVDWKPRIR